MDKKEAKGVLIFYIDVGMLPPFKAESFIETMKERFLSTKEKAKVDWKLPDEIGTFWVPVRGQYTYVDYQLANSQFNEIVDGNPWVKKFNEEID